MWILDSTGDFLSGKRVWLRPGKKYLFGRIKQDGVLHAVDHKTISRKHIVIQVLEVKEGDGTRTHARTQIRITDLGSSRGTTVDGEQIKSLERVLNGDEHTIQLGRAPDALRLKWEPVVLSFSFSSKEMRTQDPLVKVRSRLEALDIKTVIDYLVGHTTHVVQSKRNTAKGLQALINGKFIVENSYIDALVYAASPSDLENEESLSPLEIDFESSWPDPMEHLPPAGNEPTSRSTEAFSPNPSRVNVFEGYTFVFGDAAQFANLQAAINNGQGKALLYEVKDGVTTASEIIQFMKQAAGYKGHGTPEGVVLVRFRSKGEYEQWSIDLGNEVALAIDRRVIEQREFLDAILGNDASPLCRPLPREEGSSQASVAGMPSEPEPASATPLELSQSRSRSRSRSRGPRVRPFVSKMKMFDDGFDMDSIPVHTPEADDAIESQQMDMEPEDPSLAQPLGTVEEEVGDDMVSEMLPGARAMKRRREEMGEDTQTGRATRVKTEAPKTRRPKMDVLEEARKHREEEEEKQRQATEHPLESQDVNVEELKNLAIIEEMDVPLREPPARESEDPDRWDENWNGRKNFKRFRRKGDSQRSRQRIQAVIVPLEEVTRKDFGIGEYQWVSNSKTKTPEVSQHAERGESAPLREERAVSAVSRSELSVPVSATPDPTPPQSSLSRARSHKRPRQTQANNSDSDEELRFRFRRKR
ncbi:hypothetical protein N7448_001955 [Penicillium atrosanguineum]|uniref:Uncharacterized protein n=1 Tax=Penicillium atrosanguineum TaxID=1132637 RepID=A0A9W9PWC7_9EURO|nr:hypothetical protein N7526_006403 [Penicillium atrosanguineum]KAJ5144563.1 hypothetical protein N7448_001955 [Penicillium atrosanguineum]KAJ5310993.1 hypothetical protein N7476_006853 [Penicillium atrosanguineum]